MNNELIPGCLYQLSYTIRFVSVVSTDKKHHVIDKNQCIMFLYEVSIKRYERVPFRPHFLFEKNIIYPFWESFCDKQIYHNLYRLL